ncbi:MAG: L-seryl-tRNA(Sec) selenium transferase [Syntrophomonadaceae bacterium]|nr:L-seryl-tRNA(Sec) selenium transferase [Syntrophomonadaceae bacterium]
MTSLKNIPSVDELLNIELIQEQVLTYNREFMVSTVRQAINEVRQILLLNQDKTYSRTDITNLILESVNEIITVKTAGSLHKVINGTGVVLHTNLGRSLLSRNALDYLVRMATSYNNLEFDLVKGERGSRYSHIEELLVELTGAEAALVVNNNAAAVLLGLNTMANGREVIVSRGQLVEIGGAFRIPEVMKLSGANLVEVGTTNKTYLSDYKSAITEDTSLLFAAHTSNYKIVGFTEEVAIADLVRLGQAQNLPVMHDLGSGVLYDLSGFGLADEPLVRSCVASGVDILTFSGDKLLGGPQAGIIVGKKKYVEEMKKNQLTRALRVDKLTIAALEGTLIEYLAGKPIENIPTIAMLSVGFNVLLNKANTLRQLLEESLADNKAIKAIKVIELEDMIGGGSYPGQQISGVGVEIQFTDIHIDGLLKKLRLNKPALVGRVQADRLIISMRTILDEDISLIPDLIKNVLT